MLYLISCSTAFRKSALDELRKLSDCSILAAYPGMLLIEAGTSFKKAFDAGKPIFSYSILPITHSLILGEDYLTELVNAVLSMRLPRLPLKIECMLIGSGKPHSAKEIEVSIGTALEEKGIEVDLSSPKVLVLLLIIGRSAYLGYKKAALGQLPLDFNRAYSSEGRPISRAERKIREAFIIFGIPKGKGGIAIDLGAAPGGWSSFLAGNGYKVIAVDNAELNASALSERALRCRTLSRAAAESESDIFKSAAGLDILHIKANAAELRLRGKGSVSFVANDMNMQPRASARICLSYAPLFSRNALLLMSIKCVTKNAEKHLSDARSALEGRFEIKGIKALPSNRQELTLYAEYTKADVSATR